MQKNELWMIGLIALAFILGIILYPNMPDEIATHWGPDGEADGFSSKLFGLFFLPVMALIIYLIMTAIPFIAVYKKNIKGFEKPYFVFRLSMILFFVAIYIITIIQTYKPFSMNYFMLPALSFLFLVMSYLMKHAKRNFFIGFRTPWTLSSDKVWKKTHDLASIFFRVYAVIALIGLFFEKLMIYFIIIPLFLGIIYLVYYSYSEFKKEKSL